METWAGALWDRWVRHLAEAHHPQAEIRLESLRRPLSVFFRGVGGEAGRRFAVAERRIHEGRRTWRERLAGTGRLTELPHLTADELRLPAAIAHFPKRPLNRDLYFWLALLAAHFVPNGEPWWLANQRATAVALARYPAWQERYDRLVAASLALRPLPHQLPPVDAAVEEAIRAALRAPGSVRTFPASPRPPRPVMLWLMPQETDAAAARRRPPPTAKDGASSSAAAPIQTEATEDPGSQHGMLLAFRAESLLCWAEYVRVDRSLEDAEGDEAGRAAAQLERLALAEDSDPVASRVRMDLERPPAADADERLREGILLPEWDYRRGQYRPDHCRIDLPRDEAMPAPLPGQLRPLTQRLRAELERIRSERRPQAGQPEGDALDLDDWVRRHAELRSGCPVSAQPRYIDTPRTARDLSCLLLADVSLSTDAHADDAHRVIDVIRDALLVFTEAIEAAGDALAVAAFSSLGHAHVHYHRLKDFGERNGPAVRGRILALRPGDYTRLGAAIRHAADRLAATASRQKLLLVLTDGKPHDIDHYDGRYGIEDTRRALFECRRRGIRPFCVAIDREAADVLPYLFGHDGHVVVQRLGELAARLPRLYAELTRP